MVTLALFIAEDIDAGILKTRRDAFSERPILTGKSKCDFKSVGHGLSS